MDSSPFILFLLWGYMTSTLAFPSTHPLPYPPLTARMASNDSTSGQQITDASFEERLKTAFDISRGSVQVVDRDAVRTAIAMKSRSIKENLYETFNGVSSEGDRIELSITQSSMDPVEYAVWIRCYPWSSKHLAETVNSHTELFTVKVPSSTSGDRTADSKA